LSVVSADFGGMPMDQCNSRAASLRLFGCKTLFVALLELGRLGNQNTAIMTRRALALAFPMALLAACSGSASYEHEGTTEATGGRGDYVSDGVKKLAKGEIEEAIRLLTIAINHNPRRDDAFYHRAIAKQQKLDIDGALEDLTDAVRVNLRNSRAWFKRGWIHHNHRGDYQQARLDYTKAIEADPSYADAYYHRGLAYQALGVFFTAVADIEKAFRVAPVGWYFSEQAQRDLAICRAQTNIEGHNRDPLPINPK
jgi:tetratricopeptide (TPR) repeat protein